MRRGGRRVDTKKLRRARSFPPRISMVGADLPWQNPGNRATYLQLPGACDFPLSAPLTLSDKVP